MRPRVDKIESVLYTANACPYNKITIQDLGSLVSLAFAFLLFRLGSGQPFSRILGATLSIYLWPSPFDPLWSWGRAYLVPSFVHGRQSFRLGVLIPSAMSHASRSFLPLEFLPQNGKCYRRGRSFSSPETFAASSFISSTLPFQIGMPLSS